MRSPLFHAEIVAVMDAVIEGRPIDPDRLFFVLDLLDAHHWLALASDQGTHRYHAERQALLNLAQGDA
jgi:hypothetical protein